MAVAGMPRLVGETRSGQEGTRLPMQVRELLPHGTAGKCDERDVTSAPLVLCRWEETERLLGVPEDGVLRGLGDPEPHHPLGRDADRFPGLRVASHPRLAVDQHELTQPGEGK